MAKPTGKIIRVTPDSIGAVPIGRKVNGKPLSADITLGAADVGAYTKAETDAKVSAATTAASNAAATAGSANTNAESRVPLARKVNGKPLSADITLGAGDVGAYTKAETDAKVSTATTAASNAATAAASANTNANGRVPSGRTVNGKPLSADITLGAGDVGAYTKAETDTKVSAATTAASNAATAAASANTNANGRVPSGRTVNGKALSEDIALGAADVGAYTKAETDTKVSAATTAASNAATAAASANTNAESRVPAGRKVNGKALTADIALGAGDVDAYTKAQTDAKLTPSSLGFRSQLAENGYQVFPGGMILQWGVANENNAGTFPIPFPNKCFVINATTRRNGAPWDGSVTTAYILDNRQFTAGCGQLTGDLMYWTAIGY
ncbi:gp53-like domain-containing protein [Pectobacterium aquaticum]|uniref:gp53-like domain-containing protein n=1 Tax=Pectobacterium aquaticum TaxID=2204145 RepID=UPI001D02D9B7|nr:hypothetical protein [Pectobacterium aquaticum]